MLHMVMRQRRRFAFALLLTQLALYGMWSQTEIFGVMLMGLGAGAVLAAASGHYIKRLIECGAIGLLASTRMPSVTLVAIVFIVVTGAAYVLMYTPLLDRLPFRLGMRSRKTFTVTLDRRTAWNKLIPGQGHPAAYWTGTMMSARADEHDDDTLYITFKNGTAPTEEVTVTYLALTPHSHAQYLLERDTLLAGEEIVMDYTLRDTAAGGTQILSDMRVSGLPIRHAVERFFDDVLGDELDSFATMKSCKRTWHMRPVGDVALTSEMGRDSVALNIAAEDTPPEKPESQTRLSA